MTQISELEDMFHKAQGMIISRVSAGGDAGSIIGIYFSSRACRPNEWIYYLAIECTWRLSFHGLAVASSLDDNSHDGSMLHFVNQLTGRTLEGIEIMQPAFDLDITLGGGCLMSVFCDVIHDDVCWYLLENGGQSIAVEPAGILKKE